MMIILNEEKEVVANFLIDKFSPHAFRMLEGVRVALMLMPENTLAAVTYMDDVMKECEDGEPTVVINPNSEVFKILEEWSPHVDGILIHELAHLEQIRNGKMVFLGSNKILWEGVEYENEPMEETIRSKKLMSQYFKRPWEREAFEIQCRFVSERTGTGIEELMNQYIDLTLAGTPGE